MSCSKMQRSFELSVLMTREYFTVSEMEYVTNYIRDAVTITPEASSVDALADTFLQQLKAHFKPTVLEWATFGFKWASSLFQLCVHTANALTTTSTIMRTLSIIAIVTSMGSMILEIVTSCKNNAKYGEVLKEKVINNIFSFCRKFTDDMVNAGVPMHLPANDEDPALILALSVAEKAGTALDLPPDRFIKTRSGQVMGIRDSNVGVQLCEVDWNQVHSGFPLPDSECSSEVSAPIYDDRGLSDTITTSNSSVTTTINTRVTPTSSSSQTPTPTSVPTSSFQTVDEQEAVNWVKVVKKSLAIVVIAGGMLITRGDISKMNYWITLDKFKNVMSKNFEESAGVVDWFLNDVMELELYEHSECIDVLIKRIADIDRLLVTPAAQYGEFPELFTELQQLQKGNAKLVSTTGSITDPAIKNMSDILKRKDVLLTNKVEEVFSVMNGLNSRQEPVPILIYGEAGVGKTTFVEEVLVPRLAERLGLKDHTYSAKFTAADKYWPDYSNQKFALFDEAFDQASDVPDQLVASFNSVCSSGPYNMSGAFIKYQMCNFNFVFLCSNITDCPKLGKQLTPGAASAFWNRLQNPIKLSIKPSFKSASGLRGTHNFQENWSHIELTETPFTTDATSGGFTWNSALTPPTNTSVPPPAQDRNISLDDLVTRLESQYHVFKERRTAKLATRKQAADTNNFVVNIAGPSGSGKTFSANFMARHFSRYLCHDVVDHHNIAADFQGRQNIHVVNDVLPENETDYMLIYNNAESMPIFATHNYPYKQLSYTDSITRYIFSTATGYNIHTKHPGLARRLGVSGIHNTPHGKITVSQTTGLYFIQTKPGILTDQSTGKSYDLNGALALCWENYCKFLGAYQTVKFVHGEIPIEDPDLDCTFRDINHMHDILTSVTQAYRNLSYTDPSYPIYLPTFYSKFKSPIFDPQMFILNKMENPDPETLTTTLISSLRKAGVDATVRVRVGTTTYYAKGWLVISSDTASDFQVAIVGEQLQLLENGNVFKTLPLNAVVHGLTYGFKDFPTTILNILVASKNKIMSDSTAKIEHARLKAIESKARAALEFAQSKPAMAKLLSEHPLFPYACASLAFLGCSLGVGITALITKCLWRTQVEPLPDTLIGVKESWGAEEHRQFEINAKARNLQPHEIQYAKNMRFNQDRSGLHPIGDLEYENIRHHLDAIAQSSEPIVQQAVHRMLPEPTDFIINALDKAACTVQAPSGLSVHGLAFYSNFILTVNHVGNEDLTVGMDGPDGSFLLYKATCYSNIPDRDVQILQITSKQYPAARDLRKHFCQEDAPHSTYARFYLATAPAREVPCLISPAPNINNSWNWTEGGYSATYHTSKGPVTRNGYCGFMYSDKDKIYGIHAGSSEHKATGFLSLVTQPLLNSMITVQPQSTKPTPDILMPFVKMTLGENEIDLFPLPSTYRKKWKQTIVSKNAPPLMEGIYYLASVPYSNPYPKKNRFYRTDVLDIPDLPNPVTNALMESSNSLADVAGRPDVGITQIAKFSGPFVKLEQHIADHTTKQLRAHLFSIFKEDMAGPEFTILDTRTAINGFPRGHKLAGYMEPLKLSTGAGFYWKNEHKIATKRQFFEQIPSLDYGTEIVFKDTAAARELKLTIDLSWLALNEGAQPWFINTDQLKSELLPIKKAEAGKTRLFSIAPIEEVIMERSLFGELLALMVKHQEGNFFKLGISPLSNWTELFRYLTKNTRTMWETDVSRCDKHLPFVVMHEVFKTIFGDYALSLTLARMVSFATHHYKDFLYMRHRGHNSGSGWTSGLNTLGLAWIDCYAYNISVWECSKQYSRVILLRRVNIAIYSDDQDIPKNNVIDIKFLVDVYKRFDIDLNYRECDIEECYFLSHQFNVCNGIVFPKLKTSSFIRHFYWTCQSDSEHRAAMYSLILDEATCHNEEFFRLCASAIFAVLERGNELLQLCLTDWRPFKVRREAMRRVAIGFEKQFTRMPLSIYGKTFWDVFPTVEQFNEKVATRYLRAVEITNKIPLLTFPVDEIKGHLAFENISVNTIKEFLESDTDCVRLIEEQKPFVYLEAGNTNNTMSSNPTPDKDHVEVSSAVSSVLPAAASAAGTAASAAGVLPAESLPPLAINQATNDGMVTVVDNPNQAPNLLSAGGVVTNIDDASRQMWYPMGSYSVAVDAATNTVVFKIYYGTLNGPALILMNCHTRFVGSIKYAVELVSSPAYIGMFTVGWHQNLPDCTSYQHLMHHPSWVNLAMNNSNVATYTIRDVKQQGYYNRTDQLSEKTHGIAMFINVPLSNPFGTSGGQVTINTYCQLGDDFMFAFWKSPNPETSVVLSPRITFTDLAMPNAYFLIDGCEIDRVYAKTILAPIKGQRVSTNPTEDNVYNYIASDRTEKVVFQLKDNYVTYDPANELNFNYTCPDTFNTKKLGKSNSGTQLSTIDDEYYDLPMDGYFIDQGSDFFTIVGTMLGVDQPLTSEATNNIITPSPAFDYMDNPWTLTAWAHTSNGIMPNDYVRIAIATSTIPLAGSLVTTAQGRFSVPLNNTYSRFLSYLKVQAAGTTIEFDVVSPYGGAAQLTCRYNDSLGLYARYLEVNRLQAYYYMGSVAQNYTIANMRRVTDATTFRASYFTALMPRFSTMTKSSVMYKTAITKEGELRPLFEELSLARRTPRLKGTVKSNIFYKDGLCDFNLTHDHSYFTTKAVEHFTKRKVIDLLPVDSRIIKRWAHKEPKLTFQDLDDCSVALYKYPMCKEIVVARVVLHQEAEASIIALGAIGNAMSGAASASAGIIGRKKQYKHEEEMMEKQQEFMRQMGNAGMDFQREMWEKNAKKDATTMAANFKFTDYENTRNAEFRAAGQVLGGSITGHLNRQQAEFGYGAQLLGGGIQYGLGQQRIAGASALQQQGYTNQALLQQQQFDNRATAARTAYGVTNPGMNVGYSAPPTSGVGTQTNPSQHASTQTMSSDYAGNKAKTNAYVPASHSTPSNWTT